MLLCDAELKPVDPEGEDSEDSEEEEDDELIDSCWLADFRATRYFRGEGGLLLTLCFRP